jgi:Ca-activated chloride channel family protein
MARTLVSLDRVTRWTIAIAVLAATAWQVSPLGAQVASGTDVAAGTPRPTFRAGVELVSVAATVRDRRGRVVQNLSRDDFQVFDNGVPRPVVGFSAGQDGPVSLALLIDVSGSMGVADHLSGARQAVEMLLHRLRPAQDEIAVFSFDRALTEHQGFTRDFNAVRASLEGLEPFGITSLYDAIAETARRVDARESKRRAILVLTDGLDNASHLTAPEVSGIASATDVPVYVVAVLSPIDHEAVSGPGRDPGPVGQLVNLAAWTGGESFVVSTPAHASTATSALLVELRHQYTLAFEPAGQPGWRPLSIRLRNRDLSVRARSGYYGSRATGE